MKPQAAYVHLGRLFRGRRQGTTFQDWFLSCRLRRDIRVPSLGAKMAAELDAGASEAEIVKVSPEIVLPGRAWHVRSLYFSYQRGIVWNRTNHGGGSDS